MLQVDTAALTLTADGVTCRCAIGRQGATPVANKREGDGRTPLGRFALRSALVRLDRVAAPETALPWRALDPRDGWSDDPRDPAYNRLVRHPHAFSAEHLWRDDGLYDIVVVLDYNDAPPVPGMGSAIFLHCASQDFRPTEGCAAISRDALAALLPHLAATDWIEIA